MITFIDKCWDNAGERFDSVGQDCKAYADSSICESFDTYQFKANKMFVVSHSSFIALAMI